MTIERILLKKALLGVLLVTDDCNSSIASLAFIRIKVYLFNHYWLRA